MELHQRDDKILVKAACQLAFLSEVELEEVLKGLSSDFMSILQMPDELCLPEEFYHRANTRKFDDRSRPVKNGEAQSHPGDSDARLQRISEIISSTIDVPKSSIRSNTLLRSLGVDSITAIQISAKARQAGLNIRSTDILSCQRLSDLLKTYGDSTVMAKKLSRATSGEIHDELQHLVSHDFPVEDIEDILPPSGGMEWLIGMWHLSSCYRFQHVFAFALPDDIIEGRLESAWNILVNRNKILRSTFSQTKGGDLRIIIFKKLPDDQSWTSLKLQNETSSNEALLIFTRELVSSPLSPDRPPIRPYFLSHQDKKFFVLHIHHFQYDAWSLRLLVDGLRSLYFGEKTQVKGDPKGYLTGVNLSSFRDGQASYWQSYLTRSFKPSLIPGRTRVAVGQSGRLIHIKNKAIIGLRDLHRRARELSLSLNAIFLACWAKVQADHCKESSATFGLWHLGRSGDTDDLFNLAVPCMNVLPVHVHVDGTTLQNLSRQIQSMLKARSAIVQQSHLQDVNRWSGGQDDRVLLNTYVNILALDDKSDIGDPGSRAALLQPVDVRSRFSLF